MADLTPTTDVKGPPKKTAIILLGAGGAILLYFVWKKKKEKIEYNQQSFVPVTAENVGGVGAPGGGGGISPGVGSESNNALINAEVEQTKTITEFLREEAKNKSTEREQLFGPEGLIQKLISMNATKTGGGPAGEGQPGGKGGNGSGGGGEGATKTQHPTPPHIAACPSGWKWNPAYGPPGIKSCYHISKETCAGGRVHLHGYQDGKEICPV